MTSPNDPAPLAEPARPRSVTPVPLARRTTKPAPPPAGLPPSGPPSPGEPPPDETTGPTTAGPAAAPAEPPGAGPSAVGPPGTGPSAAKTAPSAPAASEGAPATAETPPVALRAAGASPIARIPGAVPPPVEKPAQVEEPAQVEKPEAPKAAPSATTPARPAPSPAGETPIVPAPAIRPTIPPQAATQAATPAAAPTAAPPAWPLTPEAKAAAAEAAAGKDPAKDSENDTAEEPAPTEAEQPVELSKPAPAEPAPLPVREPAPESAFETVPAANGVNGNLTKNPEVGKLAAALIGLRHTLATTRYTLDLPGADEAEASRAATVAQLDDYLLPRIRRLDAPLLVVVGGSTGAGKSTLVNSLVRAPVSQAGVLRPTTRAPVLVCHPADLPWFAGNHLLPGLARTSGPSTDVSSLQVVNAAHLSPGLAFLDAPDIDSVVDSNRALASQLLAAADLWLFVTTAARYADAVPWSLLRTARERGTVVSLVLDRVPPGAADEIGPHLISMLRENELGKAPLFVLPEASLDGQGLLAERVITPLRAWFDELANSQQARAAVVRRTVGGGIDALVPVVGRLADAADEQVAAEKQLADAVQNAYGEAQAEIENGMRDGVLLRGEVLSRWQELVGTGDLMRALQARIGRARDRVVATVTGKPSPGRQFQAALESGVATLIRGAAADAAEKASTAWSQQPAGAKLVTPELRKPSPELQEKAERLVRDWQRGVLDLVRQEAEGKLKIAKVSAYAVNATGLLVMVSVFAATAFIPTGLEVATAAGTTVAAQKVLEAIFGDQAVRTLAEQARTDLLTRVQSLLSAEAARFDGPRAMTMVDPRTAWRLRDSAGDVAEARQIVDLPAGEVPRPGLIKTAGDR